MQKLDRQKTILDVVSAARVSRQDELAKLLRKNGYSVTQASISRDLDELGIVKRKGFYTVPDHSFRPSAVGIVSLEAAGENMLVAKCFPGLASAAAVRIDAAKIFEIAGTIAGDDTIFIAVKDSKAQKLAIKKIWEIFDK